MGKDRIVIEVNLAELWMNEEGGTFADYIAELAAKRLLEEHREAKADFRRRSAAIADEEIREALRPAIAEAITAAIQKTDTWGEPKGQPRSLREYIVEVATKELSQPRERSYGKPRTTLVEDVVHEQVDKVVRRELEEAISKGKGDVITAVREKAAEIIAETYAKVMEGRRVG